MTFCPLKTIQDCTIFLALEFASARIRLEAAKHGKPEENLGAYFEEVIKNETTTSEEK